MDLTLTLIGSSSLSPLGWTLSSINEAVGNANVEPEYTNVTHHPKWSIPWLEDDPGMTGLQLWVNRTLVYSKDAMETGATGVLGIHWHTRDISPSITALAKRPWKQEAGGGS